MAHPPPGPAECDKGCLEYLDDPPDTLENPFSRAISNEHLKCFMEAHVRGCHWNEITCEDVARGGHLEYLRYAHENGAPWNSLTCRAATTNGHLDCLRYAHENRCPWNEDTCYYASFHGHLNCLRYAHENGCPWDSHTVWWASYTGKLACLIYALENGCPSDFSLIPPHVRRETVHRSAIPILYHHQVSLPGGYASDLRIHIRDHARRARLILRCAVRWLRAYHEACSRVYAPTGVGYHEAEISFQNTVSRQQVQPCSSAVFYDQ